MIKKLDWDTVFFNIEVGEIEFENYSNNSNINLFELIYMKNPSNFDLIIDNYEESFSENKVIFSKSIFNDSVSFDTVVSLDTINYSIEEIYTLAYESGKFSRFFLDKNIGNEKFKQLYKLWVENSISKEIADDILVYFENEKTLGFLTYKTNLSIAYVGLFSVSADYQGRGIGYKLLSTLENIVYKKGISKIIIPTQENNIVACNFYNKANYLVQETCYIKHFWKKNNKKN